MSMPIRVTCDCGFSSKVVGVGITYEEPQVYKTPVFVQATGELVPFRFRESELGLKDAALVEWVQSHGADRIRQELGDDAVGLGLWSDGAAPPMRCPKCGNMTAQFVDAGF